ncbi:MAG: hypothetical protein GY862_39525, partial [Gammaproteobacteria bacterium]|nr:hypothetical protein [Gammaproteobacteria bacterium]
LGNDKTEFRLIGHRKPPVSLFGTFDEHEAELSRLNKAGYGIYAVINEIGDIDAVKSRHKTTGKTTADADIVKPRAVFADFDTPESAAGEHMEAASQHISPSVFTPTSPGKHHAFYLVSDLPLPAFSVAQKAIAACYNSDKTICNPARIIRVPGFIHHGKSVAKKNPVAIPPSVSLLLNCDPDSYTRDDIALIVADA